MLYWPHNVEATREIQVTFFGFMHPWATLTPASNAVYPDVTYTSMITTCKERLQPRVIAHTSAIDVVIDCELQQSVCAQASLQQSSGCKFRNCTYHLLFEQSWPTAVSSIQESLRIPTSEHVSTVRGQLSLKAVTRISLNDSCLHLQEAWVSVWVISQC